MAIATSTIPATKAALLTKFSAALPSVLVTWGVPRGELDAEVVIIGNGANIMQLAAAVGQQKRDERYVIDVLVSVVKGGLDSAQVASERAFAIVAKLETVIRPQTSPPLGVAGLITAEVVGMTFAERWDGTNREAEVTVQIGCHARI